VYIDTNLRISERIFLMFIVEMAIRGQHRFEEVEIPHHKQNDDDESTVLRLPQRPLI